jgi:glucose-1-phosphate thymidylyltransferase
MQTGSVPCATDFVSMNCWRFSPAIFEACRSIAAFPERRVRVARRGPLRAGDARRAVLRAAFALPVLDLSTRADIAIVTERLLGVPVQL